MFFFLKKKICVFHVFSVFLTTIGPHHFWPRPPLRLFFDQTVLCPNVCEPSLTQKNPWPMGLLFGTICCSCLFLGHGPPCEGPRRRAFTRQPKNSKRAHLRVPAFNHTTKIHETTPRRGRKNENSGGRVKKSAKFWAPHPSGPHFFYFWACTLRFTTLRDTSLRVPSAGRLSAGPPKISSFFSLSRPHFRSFSLSRGILVVF